MRAVYFDCFAGASGDMIVGALLDLGLDLEALNRALASLNVKGFGLRAERVKRCGIAATKFHVDIDQATQPDRRLANIRSIIEASSISQLAKTRSIAAFELIARVEARVHGTTTEEVHFHEVGAVDSIVDIVAAMVGVEILELDEFVSSPLRLGRGMVKTSHGVLPVPAPATALLVEGISAYAGDLEGEFLTPTGAAILKTLCCSFGSMPRMNVKSVGYGAGSREFEGFPNTLRLIAGEITSDIRSRRSGQPQADSTSPDGQVDGNVAAEKPRQETVVVVETNIDDMNPQVIGYVLERVLGLGARDAFANPVQMKKGRPGILLTVVCDPERRDEITRLLLVETTTLGVRYHEAQRRVLDRTVEVVDTPYGEVRVKVARDQGRTLHFQPEYEDCAALAREQGVALIEIQSAASAAYRLRLVSQGENDEQGEEE